MTPLRSLVAALILVPSTFAQQFMFDTSSIPSGSGGYTESVEFGDVDRDGDWDVVFGNGGDFGNQQDRIWINLGHAQGGTVGVFQDETATRFPVVLDATRDLEFADYDGDGDLDLHVSNDAQISNQTCRFWTNQGLAQGGAIGFYVDETASRWVGLGGPGSSIPSSQWISGGFIDFTSESTFADFDADGDLDLVHTSHGGAFGGNVPTRLFLNDGDGFFSEFNASGFQIPGQNISNGNPGLWCEGMQLANTLISDGTRCDIATSCTAVDVGDLDGDFDIEILVGARQELPRLFSNRFQENGSVLAFRDVTGAAFPAGYATGNGHYSQEFGDLDADGDLDLYGVNWLVGSGFNDAVYANSSTGTFAAPIVLPGSGGLDGEVIDFDLDGDLDLFAASVTYTLHRNDGALSFALATGALPTGTSFTRDAAIADVDEDSDDDIFLANDGNQPESYLRNGTSANDVTPPRITAVEQALDRPAGPSPTLVRASIVDNATLAITVYDAVQLEVTLDNGAPFFVAMKSSGAQVFRGEIDGRLVGTIRYRVLASDEHGNAASSVQRQYVGSGTGATYCFGDGSGTACPCGNSSPASSAAGCLNSLGFAGALRASGMASVAADKLALRAVGITNASVLFFQGTAQVASGLGSVFGDGLRCAGGTIVRLGQKIGVANQAEYPAFADASISVRGAIPATGGVRDYQAWYRNAATFCTSSTFNLTNGVEVLWIP